MAERGDLRLPGVTGDDEARIVFHVDMDCFYAACERLREPELEGEPVVVGMGYESGESHGAVATASYEARAHGVESAQAISVALERLPRKRDGGATDTGDVGRYRPVDMEYYELVSERIRDVLGDCSDTVREVSIDEAYLDVTDQTSFERVDGRTLVEGYARHLKERIGEEVGVTASVGVAPNMSAAKVASDHDKPDGLEVVEPDSVREFLAPLDVERVHGVGPVTARELREMGVETAGGLATTDPAELGARFGERGREIRAFARGDDSRPVAAVGRPKSFSRESAFTEATANSGEKRERVRALATAVAERATREGALYQTIGIKVVTPPFDINTRARSLPGPVADADLLREVTLSLLSEFEAKVVRKVGVRVSKLTFSADKQANLDGWENSENSSSASIDTCDDSPTDDLSGQASLVDFGE